MILSNDRQNYFIHLIMNNLEKQGFLSYKDREKAFLTARRVMSQCMKSSLDMDDKVRRKIESLKRNVTEQSSEWQVLYSNYLEEEMVRRGFVSTKAEL